MHSYTVSLIETMPDNSVRYHRTTVKAASSKQAVNRAYYNNPDWFAFTLDLVWANG